MSQNEIVDKFNIMYKSITDYNKSSISFSTINSLIYQVSFISISFLAGILIINNKLTLGNFIAMNSYINIFLGCINYFLNLSKAYQSTKVSYNRIKDLYNIEEHPNGTLVLKEITTIELNNIDFGYGKSKLINNLNYKFVQGNIYCIKGANGSGKTTLIDLILGLIPASSGEILFNGININHIDMDYTKNNLIGVLEQEPFSSNNSVKNSISYGLKNVEFNKIIYWCKQLDIYDFVMSLPNTFDYIITEGSGNISGGEKQKLSQARIFLKNADVIILDEPDSALDKKSIQTLKKNINLLKKNKIIIIISHNDELLDISDKIINI